MAGGPGGNSRGRGGKFKKPTRGGGKHFSRNLRPLDADGNEVSMWSTDATKEEEGSDSDDESDEESEEESDDGAGPSNAAAQELSREDRKKEKKARKDAAIARAKAAAVQVGDLPPSDSDGDSEDEDEDDMPANPNHSKAARKQLEPVAVDEAAEAVSDLSIKQPQSRREREVIESAAAQARYRKLHEEGKTDEAKADMARLAVIREKREADKARKDAERQEREAQEATKRAEIEAREAKKREAALGKGASGKKSGKKSK